MADELVIGGQLGNYLIDSVVGRGGMSVVYEAKHARLGTSVAIKVLAPELSSDDTFRERFLREAQMAAGVDHPNVIPIHDLGMSENSLYIVMRFIPGGDLKTLLAAAGPLDPKDALSLLMPVALALDAAHAHGLVHRDVKPGNILIQRSAGGDVEHVYLTDFGIAKSANSLSRLTRAGGMIGTLEYMAPEQIENRDISAQTDVYALAAVFYECVTGRIPFEQDLEEGMWPPMRPLEPISSLRPELPAALDGVIAKALSRRPAERYATCEQFLRACSYVLEGRPSQAGGLVASTVAEAGPPAHETAAATPPSPPAPTGGAGGRRGGAGAWLARHKWYAAGLLAAAIAAVAILVAGSSSNNASGALSSATLGQVPTNHATGSGRVSVRLDGDVASVTLTTKSLDNNAQLAHALHIHATGKGLCPPASAAHLHNGHLTISTTDGINYYGPPVQSLTTQGDTSTASILAFPRYPTGGTIRYTRTITLPADVASAIRRNNAVIVVHGVDYDGSGIYDGVLDRSELNKGVPGTATAPALCGSLTGPQQAASATSHAPGGVYTATLRVDPAVQSVAPGALFYCEAGGSFALGLPVRRSADAGAGSEGPARA